MRWTHIRLSSMWGDLRCGNKNMDHFKCLSFSHPTNVPFQVNCKVNDMEAINDKITHVATRNCVVRRTIKPIETCSLFFPATQIYIESIHRDSQSVKRKI